DCETAFSGGGPSASVIATKNGGVEKSAVDIQHCLHYPAFIAVLYGITRNIQCGSGRGSADADIARRVNGHGRLAIVGEEKQLVIRLCAKPSAGRARCTAADIGSNRRGTVGMC